jgi:hypothetical protein
MDKIGYIEIKVSGSKGNLNLTPDNFVQKLATVAILLPI